MEVKTRKILSIEAIRGFAALYVMLGHIVLILHPFIFFPASKFLVKTIFGYGHQAVILFFIVSGFSIHYSSVNSDLSNSKEIKDYYYKRFRRIYPLLFISLIFSLIVLWITGIESGWLRNILSFFMVTDISSGSIADPIATNFPIWSLSYEVIYYLLYPLVVLGIKNYGIRKVFAYSFILSAVASIFTIAGWNNHLSNVLQMYWIWLAGAYMGELMLSRQKITIKYFKGWLIMSVALMFTLEKALFFTDWFWAIFFSLLMFTVFFPAINKPKLSDRLIEGCISFIAVSVCFFITYIPSIVYHTALVRIILLCISFSIFILYFLKVEQMKQALRKLINPFVRTGGFSYAVYILHWPILVLFSTLFKEYYQESFGFLLCFIILYICIVITSSWAAEIKLQPLVAKIMNRHYYSKRKNGMQ